MPSATEPSPETEVPTGDTFTIAVAEVVSAFDSLSCGRVQIDVPWLRDMRPWARVALPGAGAGRGLYSLPHPGDTVLVAFNRNDATDCYVVGGLWNNVDPPPRRGPVDPVTRVSVLSEVGHEIDMDDVAQTITVTTSTGMSLTLGPTGIKLATRSDTAVIEATAVGDVTVTAKKSITLDAPTVTVSGTTKVSITSPTKVAVDGGTSCTVKAARIGLN
ncbi:hypothetical protein FHE66_03600 [Georgenia sp. 311]|uniref:Gp5/Type VI secretion system Vgr protein OB-fold domain-containing protein n=1 Tax=Georgenia wutianyii TaxID=2585135 RepID=A0ABX5VRX3_9MICO|nr:MULTISPECIES: phage baseplate assembly protein V [Georgenia]QDB79390.1 hypothetical protein FE251_08415 [Georgenia wutianyii]TNC19557.1 hypothetical protein FHE66_03600 [Georgenia sp. 311]